MSSFTIDLDADETTSAAADAPSSSASSSSLSPSSDIPVSGRKSPVVVIIIGMAGSGKTTLMHRINLNLMDSGKRGYYVNLDPAVTTVPFSANIDIRDTVNYKEVMSQYGLGPNGGILTSLNLFATRFDQVIQILEKRADELDYIFIDTPGQIEVFTWSAGGQIILELLATSFPTTVMYIADTPRCLSPTTFMSNMLYACSVLYKSQLPIIVTFNKTDVAGSGVVEQWMNDFESYQEALDADREEYMSSFNRSLSLVMDEFYRNIRTVSVSAATGDGIDSLFVKIGEAAQEFSEVYLPDLELKFAERKASEAAKKEEDLSRLVADLRETRGDRLVVAKADESNDIPGESTSEKMSSEKLG